MNKLSIHADRKSRVNILKAWHSIQLQGLEMKAQHLFKCRRGMEAMMAIVTMMKFTEQMKLKWYKIWEEKLRTLGRTERG